MNEQRVKKENLSEERRSLNELFSFIEANEILSQFFSVLNWSLSRTLSRTQFRE